MTSIKSYVRLTIGASVVATAALVVDFGSTTGAEVQAAVFFSAIALLTGALAHSVRKQQLGSLTNVPLLAGLVVVPSWPIVLGGALTSLLMMRILRRDRLKTFFNGAQILLACAASVAVFRAFGGSGLLENSEPQYLPYAVAFGAFVLTNTVLVAGAVSLSERRRFWEVWQRTTFVNAANDLLASPLPYLFAWLYASRGPLWALGFILPLLGVRQIYKTNVQLAQTSEEMLELIVQAIEARDPYTSGHSLRVASYSRVIARALRMGARETERVEKAALLHDVGKMYEIYAPLLRKPARLSSEEWEIMKTHSIKSAELVQTVTQLQDLVAPIRAHHENWDGTGYPDGLRGEEIPLAARIITVADTIDAMTTDRPYRPAKSAAEVENEIRQLSGKQYDPSIAAILLEARIVHQLLGDSSRYSEITPTPMSHRMRAVVGSPLKSI